MAQIDENWTTLINEDFHNFTGWNTVTFEELPRHQGYQPVWECYMREYYTGVTSPRRHQAYQTSHAFLDSQNKMTLKGQFISSTDLICGIDFDVPLGKHCSGNGNNPPESIHYFSGTLETTDTYWFGYYEMKCKLPVHTGVKTSFWLYGAGTHYYEEIDIFEHCKANHSNNLNRCFNCGIHYNPTENNYNNANHSVRSYYSIPDGSPDISYEHTYACEWLPDRIRWFFDGEIIFECNDRNEIPQHSMRLKVTHPMTEGVMNQGLPNWQGTDIVTINYIKYNRLDFDCDSDVTIRSVNDITSYQPGVKNSIVMGAADGLVFPTNTSVVFRASEITIDNDITIPVGAQVTIISQGCPESE